ncbi:MAG: winged helix-turn-helix domain-containing protein [Pirellulaceae bacterium]
MPSKLEINNTYARRLWLGINGLASTPTGKLDLAGMIHRLGFVQIDSIRNVTRAQNHILWSRNQNYREPMLDALLEERGIFEHFTHDASVLPMEFYPNWRRQFRRLGKRYQKYGPSKQEMSTADLRVIKRRIKDEGPLSTKDFATSIAKKKGVWSRPPHKKALDMMWYAGELATSHRVDFRKFYDLPERVIPEKFRSDRREDREQVDWLCEEAMKRLSFAKPMEIARFWDAVDGHEVRRWLSRFGDSLQPVSIQAADGSRFDAFATADVEDRLANLKAPTTRLRIINPFDPAIRDRSRLERLFGFEYRNEIFVPPHKREWGYYVYPILMGDRFVARIELRADRKKQELLVLQFWTEPTTIWTSRHTERLDAELNRFGRLACDCKPKWQCRLPKTARSTG